jgi:hypothetical protein
MEFHVYHASDHVFLERAVPRQKDKSSWDSMIRAGINGWLRWTMHPADTRWDQGRENQVVFSQ